MKGKRVLHETIKFGVNEGLDREGNMCSTKFYDVLL